MESDVTLDKEYANVRALKDCLYQSVRANGNGALGGIEEEIVILKPTGKPLSVPDYERFITALAEKLPDGQIIWGKNILTGHDMVEGAHSTIGDIRPETNTTIIEFSHKPASSSHDIYRQSLAFHEVLKAQAKEDALLVLGCGVVPTIAWEDFWSYDAIIPHGNLRYSWGNMQRRERIEHSKTVFGTASIHHNLGFDDPEKMARYFQMALRLQPTMIALCGNSPFWDGQIMRTPQHEPLQSYRSQMQLNYGRIWGVDTLNYLYPDSLLDTGLDFDGLMDAYLHAPLDRTFVNGVKAPVGALTMAEYVTHGYEAEGQRHFATRQAVNMMFRVPITDVRLSPMDGPRVECRAHDTVSMKVSCAIDAFYRGLNAQLDDAMTLVKGISPDEIRRQRADVCVHGLRTSLDHPDAAITTQSDLAQALIDVSAAGLRARGRGEEALLEPLRAIVAKGHNPANDGALVHKRGMMLPSLSYYN